MSYRFECDRCHRLFTSEYGLTVVHLTKKGKESLFGYGNRDDVKHYCPFCAMLLDSAIDLVDKGVYGGNRSPKAKIGWQMPKREGFDPLVNPESQKDNLDKECDVLEREDNAD